MQTMALNDTEREDTTVYKVVVNHEEQYSIWPTYKPNPAGWKDAGKSGLKPDCLSYIKEVWTDMRPLSLRKKMEETARAKELSGGEMPAMSKMKSGENESGSLVKKLSQGTHPVEVTMRPEKTLKAFKGCIDRGYVHVKFTDTKGGTELGVRLTPDMSDLTAANFDHGTGKAKIVGDLMLDYVKVRCIANINLDTFAGDGHLEPLA
jgi:uncharacterized protein YbdZ (MbtH family)